MIHSLTVYVVNGLGVALLGHVDLIKWKKVQGACRSPEVALGGPLPSREKDTPVIGGLGAALLGHDDLAKWYKTRGAYTCLPSSGIPCHDRVGLTCPF